MNREPNPETFLKDFPRTHPYELVLFFYPSPGLDWSSPRSLFWCTLRNRVIFRRPRSIGHVSVMVRTPTGFYFTGKTQKYGHEGQREVLLDGYGMGILMHTFVGEMERAEELAPEALSRSMKKDYLGFARFEINEGIATRITDYLREYVERGAHNFYGMRPRPRYAEGGGCGPFAASVVDIAGFLSDEMRAEWTREFCIPYALIGGPGYKRYVGFWEIFFTSKWATRDEKHELAQFWDPDLMYQWMIRHRNDPKKKDSVEIWNQALGICFNYKNSPIPTEPLFLKNP